ncbi:hypothetical protein V5E38_03695 [Rossellomorea sp. GAMAL-10_SWC]
MTQKVQLKAAARLKLSAAALFLVFELVKYKVALFNIKNLLNENS